MFCFRVENWSMSANSDVTEEHVHFSTFIIGMGFFLVFSIMVSSKWVIYSSLIDGMINQFQRSVIHPVKKCRITFKSLICKNVPHQVNNIASTISWKCSLPYNLKKKKINKLNPGKNDMVRSSRLSFPDFVYLEYF